MHSQITSPLLLIWDNCKSLRISFTLTNVLNYNFKCKGNLNMFCRMCTIKCNISCGWLIKESSIPSQLRLIFFIKKINHSFRWKTFAACVSLTQQILHSTTRVSVGNVFKGRTPTNVSRIDMAFMFLLLEIFFFFFVFFCFFSQ
jgi:hypothetical protein